MAIYYNEEIESCPQILNYKKENFEIMLTNAKKTIPMEHGEKAEQVRGRKAHQRNVSQSCPLAAEIEPFPFHAVLSNVKIMIQ